MQLLGKTQLPIIDGACLRKSIVYMAEVNTQNREQKQYIGMTENDLKGRYNMHKQSFNNSKFKNSTSLSKYIWELKKSLAAQF